VTVASTANGQVTGPLTESADLDLAHGTTRIAAEGFSNPKETLIYIRGTVYVQAPLGAFAPGTSWVKLTRASSLAGSASGVLAADSQALAAPIRELRVVVQNGAIVTALGRSTVDGVKVAGYAVRETPRSIRALVARGLPEAPTGQGLSDLAVGTTTDVYVDGHGLVRREVTGRTVTQGPPTFRLKWTTTVDFSGFGEPLTVTAPPGDQVYVPPPNGAGSVPGPSAHEVCGGSISGHQVCVSTP
jgi:hypothetical protein